MQIDNEMVHGPCAHLGLHANKDVGMTVSVTLELKSEYRPYLFYINRYFQGALIYKQCNE
jgi:hypothetical protein